MKITLKQLAVFVNIVKHQSISKAADVCFISQAAASLSLQELEKALDTTLFDRTGKRLHINSNGQALTNKAQAIVDQVNDIETCFNHTDGPPSGSLKIGVSTTIGNYVLPDYLTRFKLKYPNIHFQVCIDNTENVVTKVKMLDYDFALIEGECSEPTIVKSAWLVDQLVIFASHQHPLSKKQSTTYHDLEKFPWVMREAGSGTYDLLINAAKDHFNIQTEISLNSSDAIKRYVEKSDCLGCLSTSIVAEDIKNKKLIALEYRRLRLKRNFYKLVHNNKFQSQASKIFQHFIQPTKTAENGSRIF